jgi:F0F1-type ATP synthase membrane subunit a
LKTLFARTGFFVLYHFVGFNRKGSKGFLDQVQKLGIMQKD